jgi:GntR family transcriptional repressor for pyruvate dehydrogenase complex
VSSTKASDTDSAFRPLRPPRKLSGELIARLTHEITSGNLEPNSRLPTEQEMIATFGVSRTVVREAIAALRAEGLVESRQGAGIFVAADMSRRPFRFDAESLETLQGVIDLMELRMSVEIEAAGLAAERRTQRNVSEIARRQKTFAEAVGEGDDAIEQDYLFHVAVSQATQNDYFRAFLEYLGRQIIPRRNVHIGRQSEAARRAYLRKVSGDHERILAAIRKGDAEAARAAMRAHLQQGRDRYVDVVKARGP